MLALNDLFDYEDRKIYQNTDFFKFSLDSILLAEFANAKDSDLVLDLCAGNMAVPLIMSKYSKAHFVGFEIQKSVFDLGEKSISYNNLGDNLKIINDDVNNIGSYYKSESFDVMVCNPPYFKENEALVNLSEEKRLARHEIKLKLEDIFLIAKTYLKNKGELYIVHRSLRIDEIMYQALKYNINVKEIQLISTKKGNNPDILLVKCIKNAGLGVKINKEVSIEGLKTYQNIFRRKI